MKHTPGPWQIDTAEEYNFFGIWGPETEIPDDLKCIACVDYEGDSNVPEDEAKGNARLIAAAPELLNGLIEIKNLATQDLGKTDLQLQLNRIYYMALETIQKAEG